MPHAECKLNFEQAGPTNQNKLMSGSKLQVRKMEYVAHLEGLDENIDDLDGSLEKFIGQEICDPNTQLLNLKSQRRKITDDFEYAD